MKNCSLLDPGLWVRSVYMTMFIINGNRMKPDGIYLNTKCAVSDTSQDHHLQRPLEKRYSLFLRLLAFWNRSLLACTASYSRKVFAKWALQCAMPGLKPARDLAWVCSAMHLPGEEELTVMHCSDCHHSHLIFIHNWPSGCDKESKHLKGHLAPRVSNVTLFNQALRGTCQ